MECKVDMVLGLLLSDNIMEEFNGSLDIFHCFTYYSTGDRVYDVVERIIADKEKTEAYIKGLVKIYPLSANILGAVMSVDNGVKLKLTEWIDVSNTISVMIANIINCCNAEHLNEEDEELVYELNQLKSKIAEQKSAITKLEEQHKTLLKLQETDGVSHREMVSLENDVNKLKAEWSQSAIDEKKRKLEKEKKTLEAERKKASADIKKLEKEIAAVKNNVDPAFRDAVKSLSEIVKLLPEDVSENE